MITKKLPNTNRWELVRVKLILEIRFFGVLFVDALAIPIPVVLTKIQITNVYPINGGYFVLNII